MSQQHENRFSLSTGFLDDAHAHEPAMAVPAPNAEQRAFAVWTPPDPRTDDETPLDALAIDAGILATATGDRLRFAALFELMAPRAKAYLVQRGVRLAIAEDLAIETMIQVWRTADAFDPAACSGQTWIFQVLRDASYRRGVSLSPTPPRAAP